MQFGIFPFYYYAIILLFHFHFFSETVVKSALNKNMYVDIVIHH